MIQLIIYSLLFIVIFVLSVNYWQLRNSKSLLISSLYNEKKIEEILNLAGKDNLKIESKTIKPIGGHYDNNLSILMRASISTLDNTSNILLILLIGILLLSLVFKSVLFSLILLAVSFLIKFIPATGAAEVNVYKDIYSLALVLYRWYKEKPVEVFNFVKGTTALFKLYMAVSNIR